MLRSLLLATRPKTLPAAITPVWLGCVLTIHLRGEWSFCLMIATLLSAICIQIATNLFNDALDARKGADTPGRLGPMRATASGLVSPKVVFGGAFLFLAIACVFAVELIVARGWPIFAIGVPSLYLAYGYTGGPLPLAYRGLGEAFVFLFFGLIATMGTVFVQTGEWLPEAALLGGIVGMLSCFLISINNLRDREEDASTGKKTLTVRLGSALYKRLMLLMGAHTTVAILALWWWLELPIGFEMVFVALAWVLMRSVMVTRDPRALNKHLALSGLALVLFGALFQIAVLLK